MEALAAVGLATNIITFVDFAATLVKGAREISSSGSLSDLEQIQSETAHLQRLVQPLRVHPGLPVSGEAKELATISQECVDLANATSTVLAEIYAHGKDSSRLTNVRVAFRAMRKKGKLESLQKRLDSCQGLILTQITMLIRQDQTSVFALAKDISKRHDENAVHIGQQLDSLRGDVISAVDKSRTHSVNGQSVIARLLEDVKSRLELLINIDKEAHRVKVILDKLWFDGMLDREAQVHSPAGNSYRWLLDGPQQETLNREDSRQKACNHFNRWLTSESGLFYISGKPGSGKSTLMKFLVQNTTSQLNDWATAHSRKLLVVNFFFWISGSPAQRSIEGLYRAILWEILKASPQLLPDVFPSRFEEADNKYSRIYNLPLSFSEIQQTLERLRETLDTSHALCLFIDGLDEYDGDHWKLGHELASWRSDYVKICVSARPYNPFDQTLPLNDSRHFRLQDLNKEDIRDYVKTTLSKDQRFRDLQAKDRSSSLQIAHTLVNRAEGVFLWAVLATRALLDGLGNMYPATQMLRFLRTDIPSGLEELFLQLLDRLPKNDRKLAAISLLFMSDHLSTSLEQSSIQRGLIFHWYIEETFRKSSNCSQYPESFSRLNLQQSTSDQILAARSRFNSRCAGFIDWIHCDDTDSDDTGSDGTDSDDTDSNNMRKFPTFRIAHRTLGDFLQQPDTKRRLNALAEGVDVPSVISSACLNILHDFSAPQTKLSDDWPFFWDVFMVLVHIAETSGENVSEHFDKIAMSTLDLPNVSPDISSRTDLRLSIDRRNIITQRHVLFCDFGRVRIRFNDLMHILSEIALSCRWSFLVRTGRQLIHRVPEISRPTVLLITAISALSVEKEDLQKPLHFARYLLEEDVGPDSRVIGRRSFRPLDIVFDIGIDSMDTRGLVSNELFSPTATVWELFLPFASIALLCSGSEAYNALKLIELFLTFGANPDSWLIGIKNPRHAAWINLPAKLYRVSLRQMVALSNLPISDTIRQYLQRPEADPPRSSSNLCTLSEEANDSAIAFLPTEEVLPSSFFPLGVAEGQCLSSLGSDNLFVCKAEEEIVLVGSQEVDRFSEGQFHAAYMLRFDVPYVVVGAGGSGPRTKDKKG